MKGKILSFVIISVIMASCGEKQQEQWNNEKKNIGVIEVTTGDFVTYARFPASIEGINNSEARAKVAGYITDVLVDEGQKVHKGQLLFKLETATLTKQAEAAKANVNAAQVKVDQLEPLVEKGIVSQSQLETAIANLKQAESSYSSIVANISYANITSPVDGYVGKIRIRKGNLVSPNDPMPLTIISDIDKLYAYFSMSEKSYLDFMKHAKGETKAEKIQNLPKVALIMANGDEYQHKGEITSINSQVDKATGSVSFRVVYDNPEHLLTNGSTGKILIPTTYDDALIVPRKSTYEQQGFTYVMKVEEENGEKIVKPNSVIIRDETASLYLIEEGNVRKGDFIMAEGVDKIQSGTPVEANVIPFDSIAKPLPALFD